MNLLKAARNGYADRYPGKGTASMPLPGSSSNWWQLGPRTNLDYKLEIGEPMANSIVAVCFGYLVDSWTQSSEAIFRKTVKDGRPSEEIETEHLLLDLLNNPNPLYGGRMFREAILQDIKIEGTAYAHVEFDRYGIPVNLWWLPTNLVRWEYNEGKEWVKYFEYTAGGTTKRYSPEEVIIWREGKDAATGGRLGYSRFKAAIAEVFGDNEARNTVNLIMRNRAVMGIVASPSDRFVAAGLQAGSSIDELIMNQTTANELETKIQAKNGVDGRGVTNVFSRPVQFHEFQNVLQHLDSQAIRSLPETRVAGCFGLPPVVVQLLSGINASSDKNNIQFAHRMAWMTGVIPLQDRFAAPINEFLLPQMDLKADTARYDYDRTNVEALQEDANALSERVLKQWEDNAITHGEMRTALGMPVDKGLEKLYFKDIQAAQAEHAANLAAMTQPTPAAKELMARKWRERNADS